MTQLYFSDMPLENVPKKLPDRLYPEPVNLDPMVRVVLGQAASIQENLSGENEIYFHSNGLPGTFTVLDAETGKKKFSEKIPDTEAVWAMSTGIDKNVYFAGTGDGKLYRYLPVKKKLELLGANPSDAWVWDIAATEDGKVYGGTFSDRGNGKLFEYDMMTNIFRNYGSVLEGQDYVRGIAVDKDYIYAGLGTNIHLFKVHRITGEKTEIILYDPTDNWLTYIELEISPEPVRIQALETGPGDGRLYFGGYQRGMSVYNPFKEKIDVNISYFAQPEGIGFLNDNVYYGTYVSAVMYRYNPMMPVSLNNNPQLVYHFNNHQDRPFAITSGDNKLFVGTVPDYGRLGGSLAIYNEKSDTWSQFDNVVENQSIIGLAYKHGHLYGSTSIWGGLGSEPKASDAKIFIWDVEGARKIDEFTPEIPGIDRTPKMIGELSFGPYGYLWGATEGTIFAIDMENKKVVKSRVIEQGLYNTSKWKPYRLRWSPDGLLYTTLSRKIIVIEPETLSYRIIYDGFVNDMVIGIDGSIYFAPEAGTTLARITVPETDATLLTIRIDGKPLKNFSPGTLEYNCGISHESVIEAIPTQKGATVVKKAVPEKKQAIIRVTAIDGKSTLTYRLS